MLDIEKYGETALNYFHNGYNCSQAVMLAFKDKMGISEEEAKKLSFPFGGGFGRLRDICGALSASAMVISMLFFNTEPEGKAEGYAKVQKFASDFADLNGSIYCRELLGLDKDAKTSPVPQERNKEFYEKRPCERIVREIAKLVAKYINERQ